MFNAESAHKESPGGIRMAKCPACGKEIPKPKKTWSMAGRPDKAGKRMRIDMASYECSCGKTFRQVMSKMKCISDGERPNLHRIIRPAYEAEEDEDKPI